MDVFISWSGDKSKSVAAALRDWIPMILQNAQPWMSDHDISSGQDWNQRITGQLANAKFGIICVTPENQDRPWLNYEAGAISKQVGGDETRVAPLLIDFGAITDLAGPLTKFHARLANQEGIKRLVLDLNAQLEAPLEERLLQRSFQRLWPDLETELDSVHQQHPGTVATRRTDRDLLEELLELVRSTNHSQVINLKTVNTTGPHKGHDKSRSKQLSVVLSGAMAPATKAGISWFHHVGTNPVQIYTDRDPGLKVRQALDDSLQSLFGTECELHIDPDEVAHIESMIPEND